MKKIKLPKKLTLTTKTIGDYLGEQIGDSLVEYLTEKYGYCIEHLNGDIKIDCDIDGDLDDDNE